VSVRRRRAGLADESGATALEFALVLPIFVSLIVGILQFGWAQHKLSAIRFAMETSSRTLLLNPNTSEATMKTLVKNQLTGIPTDQVNISLAVVSTAAGDVAQLTGSYTTNVGVPLIATYPISWSTVVSTALPTT